MIDESEIDGRFISTPSCLPPAPSTQGPCYPSFRPGAPPAPFGMPPGPPGLGGPRGPPPPMIPPPPTSQQLQRQLSQGAGAPVFTPPGVPPMPGVPPPSPGVPGMVMPPTPGTPTQKSQRIDPAAIPRPTGPERELIFETRIVEGKTYNPPPSTSRYTVRDCGNANPRYLRSTLHHVPCTEELCRNSAMPLAVCVQPMAAPDPADDPLLLVSFGEHGPLRCDRCKAYVNPYLRWIDNGRRYLCNFCGMINDCPPDYYAPLGFDGRRRDANERPELCKGSVEFVAPQDYMVRPPMAPAHLFLIDVSPAAVSTGATSAACAAVAEALEHLQGGERALVGIAAFDAQIYFYSMHEGRSQPQLVVVPDVADPYAPAGGVLVPLERHREDLKALLEAVPRAFSTPSGGADNCGAAAIVACIETLKPTGGKLHVFASSMPGVGALALKPRDLAMRDPGDRDVLKMLAAQVPDYFKKAEEAAEAQICIDLFLMPSSHVDLATLSDLSRVTGGSVYHYYPWNAMVDAAQLVNDLRWNVMRPQALEALMRVRVSSGLTVQDYLGCFHRRTFTDCDFPAIDSDKSVVCVLGYDGAEMKDNEQAFVQAALLYTTTSGERRIRVHTLALPVAASLGTTFRGADLDAQFALMARKMALQLPQHHLMTAREHVTSSCVGSLFAYRKYCANTSSPGQLILPESLKLLALYCLGLHKSPLLRTSAKGDERTAALYRVLSFTPEMIAWNIAPRLFPLHTIDPTSLLSQEDGAASGQLSALKLPPYLPVSSEKLEAGGAFLVENGLEAFIYVGPQASPDLVMALLGVPQLEDAHAAGGSAARGMVLPVLPASPLNMAVHRMLDAIRSHRRSYMRLRVLRRNDPFDALFHNLLIEDKQSGGQSYVDYLCAVHRAIQHRMN